MAKKIMIVDANETLLDELRTDFEAEGWHVFTRSQAVGTIYTIHKELPDAVLLSTEMPGFRIDELEGALAEDERTASIPVFQYCHGSTSAFAAARIENSWYIPQGHTAMLVRMISRLLEDRQESGSFEARRELCGSISTSN